MAALLVSVWLLASASFVVFGGRNIDERRLRDVINTGKGLSR
jgi:hypothetical protein